MLDMIVAALAHLSLLCAVLSTFVIVEARLKNDLADPPTNQLILISGLYGGLSLLVLHLLSWPYSGLAGMGVFGMAFIGPFVGLHVAYSLRKVRRTSAYHQTLYMLGLVYIPVAATMLAGVFLIAIMMEEAGKGYIPE